MQGFDTLWLRGNGPCWNCYASKVEETSTTRISRYDLGREKFVDQVWEWKEEYASHIREQWAKWAFL